MSEKDFFNFRDVLARLGMPPNDNKINWAVGHLLSKEALKCQVPIARILTEKTNPLASVAAPHCIASYPMHFFPQALAVVEQWWGDRDKQLDFFDWENGNATEAHS